MRQELTETEQALIELVHFLIVKNGMPIAKVYRFLDATVTDRKKTVLECVRTDGRAFVNELKTFINQSRR